MALSQVTRVIFPLIGDRLSTEERHGKAQGDPTHLVWSPVLAVMTGAGMSLTTMDMVLVVVSNPSFALNITVFAPVWVNVGDQENAPVVVLKVAPVGMVGAEKRFIIAIRVRGRDRELYSGKLDDRSIMRARNHRRPVEVYDRCIRALIVVCRLVVMQLKRFCSCVTR